MIKKRINPADDTRRNRLKTRREIADLHRRVKALEKAVAAVKLLSDR